MAVRSLARSGIGTGGKYISFLAGNDAFDPSSDFLIEEQILASTTTTVTFSSIPSTYKHLQIRVLSRSNRSDTDDNIILRFNSDSGSNYSWHRLGMTTSAGLTAQGSANFNGFYTRNSASTNTANSYGANIIDILDYSATTKYTTARALDGQTGTYGAVGIASGAWLNTAAITSISMTVQYGTGFLSGSRFSLYGSNG